MPFLSSLGSAAACVALLLSSAGCGSRVAAESSSTQPPPPFASIRDCQSCVAVPGYGWCPLARRCSPGYPGKSATSCRGDESDHARASVTPGDDRLKELLQEEERAFNIAVLYFNVETHSGNNDDDGDNDDDDKVVSSSTQLLDTWEGVGQALSEERDLRLYSIDCAIYASTCRSLLPEAAVESAASASPPGSIQLFYSAAAEATKWTCPGGAEMCDQAFPQSEVLGSTVEASNEDLQLVERAVAAAFAEQRGFPLPKLEELAADFVRVAVMRSGDVDGDALESALLAKAEELVAQGGEYARTPQHLAAAQHFIGVMKAILNEPAGRGGRRVSLLSKLGNKAASLAKGNHGSLESYVNAKARDYAVSSMTRPLLGR